MARRSHKKSRNGCLDCKRRHVKCDENRPACVNCTIANLECSYRKQENNSSTPGASSSGLYASDRSVDSGRSILGLDGHLPTDPIIQMDQLELLHNFTSDTYKTFIVVDTQADIYRRTIVKYGLAHPWLMCEILALSALHLSFARPDQRSIYARKAAELQAHALTGFNAALAQIDEESCLATFMFAALVSCSFFAENFTSRPEDISQVLDKLVSCINLLRGIQAISEEWGDAISKSELNPLLAYFHDIEARSHHINSEECSELFTRIRSADLSPATIAIYEDVVQKLQLQFRCHSILHADHPPNSTNMIFAWPVTVSVEYTDLLMQRRPEALIILAHYAVILHKRREAWPIGDAGQYLLDSINTHLGKYWQDWLAWPNVMINGGQTASPTLSVMQGTNI